MANTRKRIGQILLHRGLLTRDQLEQALAHQVVAGGRLGTVVIEREWVGIDDLASCLGTQHDVPVADPALFESVDDRVLDLVSVDLCIEYHVCPIELHDDVLALAMQDPGDEQQLTHLQQRLRLRIAPRAVPELRLFYYLESLYGILRSPRYLRVPDSMFIRETDERRTYMQPSEEAVMVFAPDHFEEENGPTPEVPHQQPPSFIISSPPQTPPKTPRPPPVPSTSIPEGIDPEPPTADSEESPFIMSSLAGDPSQPPSHNVEDFIAKKGISPPARPDAEPSLAYLDEVDNRSQGGNELSFDVDMEDMVLVKTEQAGATVLPPLSPLSPKAPTPAGSITCANCSHIYAPPKNLAWSACPKCAHSDLDDDWGLPDFPVVGDKAPKPLPITPNSALAEISKTLDKATQRDEVLLAAVQPITPQSTMSALLLVRQQLAVGLAVHGSADTAGEIQSLVVPLNTPSILQRVFASHAAESCAVEEDGMLRMITAYLQQPSLKHGCVVPVILADRVINLLCVFSASGATFGEEEIIDLQDLATFISHAYAKLIHRKK